MINIFFGAADAMARKRRCTKCGKVLVVPRDKIKLKVKCPRCGADVPPPRDN